MTKPDAQNQAPLYWEKSNGVAVVYLNRPAAFNALNQALTYCLVQAFAEIDSDDEVMAVVLTGNGRAFSAGVDLKELTDNPDFLSTNGLGPASPVVNVFTQLQKPIIAAVNGVAVTGGFELALLCDFIYASESARFADTHAFVGILPGWGLSQKLPRLVGINRAREISFTGSYFSATEGYEWGLVNRVLADEELLPAAIAQATRIAEADPNALYKIKKLINEGDQLSLGDALQMEGQRSQVFSQAVDYSAMGERLAKLKQRANK